MNIIETEVWCSENDKNQDLGLDTGDCWMPIAIDFDRVIAIKLAGENDFLGKNKATVYLLDYHIVVSLEYHQAIDIWKKNENRFNCSR